MFSHARGPSILSPKFAYFWIVLSFQAGALNAAGYLACHRFVSHVTGYGTLYGVEASRVQWSEAWGMLSVPIFFILGAMVSAFYVDRRVKPFLCVGPWSEPLFAKRMATKVFGCQRPWPFIFG